MRDKELNSNELDQVAGGMANPIYQYYDATTGKFINPETKEPFENEKKVWEYYREKYNKQ